MASLRTVIGGIGWTSGATIALAIVATVRLGILSRILEKADFGLAALAFFVLNLSYLLAEFGIHVALMHRKSPSERLLSSLYAFTFSLSVAAYLVLFVAAPFVADYFEEPELSTLLRVTTLSLIFSTLGGQHKTLLHKDLRFDLMAYTEIAGALIALAAAIVFALLGFGVYALVFSALIQVGLSSTVYAYIGFRRHRYTLRLRWSEIASTLRIGGFYSGGQVLNYFSSQADVFIIGKILGVEILGPYNLMKILATKPTKIVAPVSNRVSMPLLAEAQDDPKRLKLFYRRLLKSLSTIGFPLYLTLAVSAPSLVRIFYGSEYSPYAYLFSIFCLYQILRALLSTAGILLVARGRTDLGFYWDLVLLATLPMSILAASYFSIATVVWTMTLLMAAYLIGVYFFIIRQLLAISFREYVASFEYGIYFGIAALGIGLTVRWMLGNGIEQFLVSAVICLLVWIGGLLKFGHRIDAELHRKILNRLPIKL